MTGFETLSCMPDRVTSGDRLSIALDNLSVTYPVGTFSLQVVMKLGGGAAIIADLTDTNGVHAGSLDFTNAAPGNYAFAVKATRVSDSAVRTVQSGSILVLADPATQDTRSHAEKVLSAIEALIEGRATHADSSYTIAGRSLTRLTPDELVKWRDHYRNEVAIQRRAGKPNGGRKITLARFN